MSSQPLLVTELVSFLWVKMLVPCWYRCSHPMTSLRWDVHLAIAVPSAVFPLKSRVHGLLTVVDPIISRAQAVISAMAWCDDFVDFPFNGTYTE